MEMDREVAISYTISRDAAYRGSALSHSLTTRQASLDATDRSVAPLLLKGFRRWAPTRPVSRPDRQPATGPPGSYPDRTFTGRRRRASDQVMIAGQPPPDALGARNFGLDHQRRTGPWPGRARGASSFHR